MFDLHGKKALVTGSTQGIGFAVAKALAERGACVFVHGARNAEKCQAASLQIPGSTPVLADLLISEQIRELHSQTGDVDILIINASIQYKEAWNNFSEEQYDTMMDCNVKASYLLMQAYAPAMQQKGWGRIVAMGSCNQYRQHPTLSLYAVSKAAQRKMVQNFAPALAPYGVTVNTVSPGAIETPRNADVCADAQSRAAVEAAIPSGRFGTPLDIAPAVLLLCSDEGAYITGADLVIDGGLSLT
ncbi:MAG: SDR family oxidoreductase [Ruminococcaceae bacterium]|nr:SDR family oxidoreductase [Oscillospiraceae bacterium]